MQWIPSPSEVEKDLLDYESMSREERQYFDYFQKSYLEK